jgi:hypothetical protein
VTCRNELGLHRVLDDGVVVVGHGQVEKISVKMFQNVLNSTCTMQLGHVGGGCCGKKNSEEKTGFVLNVRAFSFCSKILFMFEHLACM